MTQKKDNTKPGSTPELPGHIAKEYGLHSSKEQEDNNTSADVKAEAPEGNELDVPKENSSDYIESGGDFDDSKTDAAVDDILKKESDELLAAKDVEAAKRPAVQVKKRGFWHGVGRFFGAWWRHGWSRWLTILLILAAITAAALMQDVRYSVLNYLGVRSSASVVVLDSTTKLPLKGVKVTLDNKEATTDVEGTAKFKDLEMGDYKLAISRVAFSSYHGKVTIGWGSNPLGKFKLEATGLQYTVFVKDYLTGQPIPGAEVATDGINALSDDNGKVILTVEDPQSTTLPVTVGANGYRSESIELDANNAAQTDVILVPNGKSVFTTKQTGKYDIYSCDLDGKNWRLLLAGTGKENSNLSLVVSPDGAYAAYVSTRDDYHDDSGNLLSSLTIINVDKAIGTIVDHAEQIQLIDWSNGRLVYRTTAAGSEADSQRNRVISLNYSTNSRTQLAAANQFSAVLSADGNLYYAASNSGVASEVGLFTVGQDGSNKKRLLNKEVWTILRTTHNSLSIQTSEGWYSHDLVSGETKSAASPDSVTSYLFVDSISAQHSIWADISEGKGALMTYDLQTGASALVASQNGLTNPIRWIGNSMAVYRVSSTSEIADYIVSINGGSPHKIANVAAVPGYAQAN